ncbi:MAG: hypothetical protein H0X68_11655 [Chloroflexi bacterium]|nr:hypothetical protein [Chloroflexota bacterium]
MKLERVQPTVYRLTLHAYEAAALMAAARLAAEGTQESLPDEAAEQLRQILASYDRALAELGRNGAGQPGLAGSG